VAVLLVLEILALLGVNVVPQIECELLGDTSGRVGVEEDGSATIVDLVGCILLRIEVSSGIASVGDVEGI